MAAWDDFGAEATLILEEVHDRVSTELDKLPAFSRSVDLWVRIYFGLVAAVMAMMIAISLIGYSSDHNLKAIGTITQPIKASNSEVAVAVDTDETFEAGDSLVIGRGASQETIDVVDVSSKGQKKIIAVFRKNHPEGVSILAEKLGGNWAMAMESILSLIPLFLALGAAIFVMRPSLIAAYAGPIALIPRGKEILGKAFRTILFYSALPIGLGIYLALVPIQNDPAMLFPVLAIAIFASILAMINNTGTAKKIVKGLIWLLVIITICLYLGGRKHVERKTSTIAVQAQTIAQTTGASLINLTKPAHPDFDKVKRCDETFGAGKDLVIMYDATSKIIPVKKGCFGYEVILSPEMAKGYCWRVEPQGQPDWYIAFQELDARGNPVRTWGPYDKNTSYEKVHGTRFRLQGSNIRIYPQGDACNPG
jgi:hypothetical protein